MTTAAVLCVFFSTEFNKEQPQVVQFFFCFITQTASNNEICNLAIKLLTCSNRFTRLPFPTTQAHV